MGKKLYKIKSDADMKKTISQGEPSALLRVSSTVIVVLYLISVLAMGFVYCVIPSRKTQLTNVKTFRTEIFEIYIKK